LGREVGDSLSGESGELAASISLETRATGFEYLLEDPLLSAVFAAESINRIQGEGVISTIKHYSLNCIETNRHWLDAFIDPLHIAEDN
jgi:beta-glucosidase